MKGPKKSAHQTVAINKIVRHRCRPVVVQQLPAVAPRRDRMICGTEETVTMGHGETCSLFRTSSTTSFLHLFELVSDSYTELGSYVSPWLNLM